MNFGPLNREGGWRRLNVAISRARKSMIVYSTLRPEQIDLSRTRAEGIAGLKGFLEFANRGKSVLLTKATTSSKPVDKLVTEIAEAIKKMGYEVKCNIGCSEYKMDIAVVNGEKLDTYLLGILLDGQNCKESATAKDRFILQPDVLKGLGWRIMRVWTLEWLDNPEKVLNSIKEEIEKALVVKAEPVETNSIPREEIKFEKLDTSEIETFKSIGQPYIAQEVGIMGMANDFYELYSQASVLAVMQKILDREAPMSRKALMRKVLSGWGISRSGSRVESVFDLASDKLEKQETKDLDNVFYWKTAQNPDTYTGYRVEDQNGNKRSMDDISSYEILNAIVEVLKEQVSLTKTDLIRETAKKFGFSRLGNVIDVTVQNAIEQGVKRNLIVVSDGDKVALV
jgi:hypothetical protein